MTIYFFFNGGNQCENIGLNTHRATKIDPLLPAEPNVDAKAPSWVVAAGSMVIRVVIVVVVMVVWRSVRSVRPLTETEAVSETEAESSSFPSSAIDDARNRTRNNSRNLLRN